MRKYIKIELIIFIIIMIIGLSTCYRVFKYRAMGGGGGFENFYAAKDNTIDVMVYGSSHASCTVNNGMLWDDEGISSFILSSGSQSIDSTYYFIKESLKTQHPKVIMVETLEAPGQELSEDGQTYNVDVANIYRSDLCMKWSPLYVDFVLNQTKLYGFDDEFRNELLLKMPIIHSRYAELTRNDFVNEYYFKRGYGGGFEVQPSDEPVLTEERKPISDMGREYLQKIIDLCNDEGIGLVLFCAPYPESEEECAQQNSVSDLAADNGVTYIDFNRTYSDIGIDFDTDFRDGNHLNNSGADKVTAYLENYLNKNYDLEDHRGDTNYVLWDDNSRYLQDKDDLNLLQNATDINDYLELLGSMKDKYDIVLTLSGNYNAMGEDSYADSLKYLGINMDSYMQGGAFVIKNGLFEYYSDGDDSFLYSGSFEKQTISVSRKTTSDNDNESVDSIVLGEDNYAIAQNGINIVVYDPEINLVIDVVNVDVYQGLDCNRPDGLDL